MDAFSLQLVVLALYSLIIVKEKLDWITFRQTDKIHRWENLKSVLTTIFVVCHLLLMVPR
jgi:hypothetical protein